MTKIRDSELGDREEMLSKNSSKGSAQIESKFKLVLLGKIYIIIVFLALKHAILFLYYCIKTSLIVSFVEKAKENF